MRNLLTELGYDFPSSSALHMDNNSAIAVCKNPEHCSKLKHMNLRLYWLSDSVQSGIITPWFCPTEEMAADLLTKALPPATVKYLRTYDGSGLMQRRPALRGSVFTLLSTFLHYILTFNGHLSVHLLLISHRWTSIPLSPDFPLLFAIFPGLLEPSLPLPVWTLPLFSNFGIFRIYTP